MTRPLKWRPHPMQAPIAQCEHGRFKAWYTMSLRQTPFVLFEYFTPAAPGEPTNDAVVLRCATPEAAVKACRASCEAECGGQE